MKLKFLVLLTLVLAMVCAWQWRALHAARTQLSENARALQMEVQAHQVQEHKTKALEEQQYRSTEQISQLSSLVAAFRATDANYASNFVRLAKQSAAPTGAEAKDSNAEPPDGLFGKGMSGMVAKMMKDPAMKEMIRSQQKAMMGMMYGGLSKDLNLTPEQNEKLTELLLDQQMQTIDSAQSLFNKDGAGNTNALAAIGDQQKQSEASIKALLGDEKFGQYEEYKKTMGERVQLNLFKTQLDGGDSPLQDNQVKRLMSAIAEERAKNPPSFSQDSLRDPANFEKMLTADVLEKQMQWQEEINGRVLERAGQILTPEQLKAYGDFQKQQLNMQKLGMKMAREMFGNKDGTAEPQAPPQVEK